LSALALFGLILMPAATFAGEDSATASEVKEAIKAAFSYSRENLKDKPGLVSEHGSLEFWSSGGLMQWLPAGARSREFEYNTMTPKHIKVIPLVEGQVATAMYYVEGGYKVKGGQPVDHYLTRATEVLVKEDDSWVVRAAHWSPIVGGTGTNATALP
jgi:hypothetical protein